jgi:integrase/recombinase XerD
MTDTILHKIVRESPKLAPSTRDYYLRDVDSWVAYAGADPRGWTRDRAQAYYMMLITPANEGGQGLLPQSANRKLASLSYASSWWAKKQNRPDLHFAVVEKAGNKRAAKRDALTPEDAAKLIATCDAGTPIDLRDRALIVVGLETGMRRMSLVGMDLDKIQKAKEGYPVALVPLKGAGSDLYAVPLSDTAMAALEPWRAWLRKQRAGKGAVFRPLTKRIGEKSGKLAYELDGDRLSLVSIYKIVVHRAEQAGLKHVHPHIFRHTFITWRIDAGMKPY